MVKILQLLCPERHCAFALAYEENEGSREQMEKTAREGMKELGIHGHCGICGSTDLRFEEGTTRFRTMEEAKPALEQAEADNLVSRALLDSIGATFDSRRDRDGRSGD